MEELKISDKLLKLGLNLTYKWFWQSDPDPWKEKDRTKWKWTAYADDVSSAIEEAYSLKKPIVDIGAYRIEFEKMIQISKADNHKIRRVKREESDEGGESRFLAELPEPIQQDEKTMNHAFETS